MLLALLQGISFATAPLLSFGPFKVFVLSSAVNHGWRRALPLATVPLVADIPIIILLWVVLQQVPDWSVEGLRTLGGLFYIYLAIRLVRSARTTLTPEMLDVELKRSYWQAVLAVWITPAAYINWSVIGVPALLTYADQSLAHVTAFLVGFYAVWVGGLAAQIWIVGQADRVLEARTVYLVYGGSMLLVAFGIYQIWLGLSNIIDA
jgi:threonine/homoserine/homoserine lactone efflux protein